MRRRGSFSPVAVNKIQLRILSDGQCLFVGETVLIDLFPLWWLLVEEKLLLMIVSIRIRPP